MHPTISPNYSRKEFIATLLPANSNAEHKLVDAYKEMTTDPHALLFRYGRTGLYYLIKALDGENKKVILTSYTCVVVANAILSAKAKPVFIDIEPGNYTSSCEQLFSAIDDDTVMVIVTHLFGITLECKDFYLKIKEQYPNVFVLQDCAHSFFCNDSTGTCVSAWGDGSLFGMNISKLVNSVQGGALTLKNRTIYEKIQNFSNQNAPPKALITSLRARLYVLAAGIAFSRFFYRIVYLLRTKLGFFTDQLEYYNVEDYCLPKNYNIPISNFEAKIGYLSMLKLNKRISARKKIVKYYIECLSNSTFSNGLIFPSYQEGFTWSHFPIVIDSEENRTALINKIEKSCNVELGTIMQYSVSDLKQFQKMGFQSNALADDLSKRIINLPLTFEESLMPVKNWSKIIDKLIYTIELHYRASNNKL